MKLLIFTGDPTIIERQARDLIAKIDAEMGFPDGRTETWQKELVRHPTDPTQVGVWVRPRIEQTKALQGYSLTDIKPRTDLKVAGWAPTRLSVAATADPTDAKLAVGGRKRAAIAAAPTVSPTIARAMLWAVGIIAAAGTALIVLKLLGKL